MKITHFNSIHRDGKLYVYEYHTEIRKLFSRKPVSFRFISKYPHYMATDILWMLDCTNQHLKMDDLLSKAGDTWSEKIDIKIGELTVMKIDKANFTREVLEQAVGQQTELESEWSNQTGIDYPDLNMPKR